MRYNYVLPYTKRIKVHCLEFLIDKLRMEKGLKGISKFPEFSMMCQIFQKISLTFPGFQRLFEEKKTKKNSVFPGFRGCVATLNKAQVN